MSNKENIAVRFSEVSFEHDKGKVILDEASFALRAGSKFTLMGQNGAGKSTLLNLITGELQPEESSIFLDKNLTIAYAKQVIPRDQLEFSIKEFFEKCFTEKIYNIDHKIDSVLEIVNLNVDRGKKIKSLSGGQQAKLLMASALIQDPDLLILDEPTNNLDQEAVGNLMTFLMGYEKTCIVVSHDADFLNSFTDGVLYLDAFTKKIRQYQGDYYDVVNEIAVQIEKEKRKNAQYEKEIKANKEKANFFANKGGKMRLVARKMREKAKEMEEAKLDIMKEDKAIRPFEIPVSGEVGGELINISSLQIMKGHQVVKKEVNISLYKNEHLLISGPNGIGKTTLLESLTGGQAHLRQGFGGQAEGVKIAEGVELGYYRQDFSTLDFEKTVFDTLFEVMKGDASEERLRSTAAGFLLNKEIVYAKVGSLSEGQKGLVAFARLMLQEPGILILDEPTNHINFRHLPVIAEALDKYKGAMILVSHAPDFVSKIRIDKVLDLEN